MSYSVLRQRWMKRLPALSCSVNMMSTQTDKVRNCMKTERDVNYTIRTIVSVCRLLLLINMSVIFHAIVKVLGSVKVNLPTKIMR